MLAIVATLVLLAPDEIHLTVDGVDRTALVFAPTAGKGRHPAVMAFHGHGGNARYAMRSYKLEQRWPEAYVVYGQGLPSRSARFPKWNGGNGWQLKPGEEGDRDIKYVDALLGFMGKKGDVDLSHVYYLGHSNGSAFAWVVLKELGNKFAAFAGFCGGSLSPLDGAPKRPCFVATGKNDEIVPTRGVLNFAERLAEHNGCGSPKSSGTFTFYPGATRVILEQYDGGHAPPQSLFDHAIEFFKTGTIKG